MLTEIAQFPLRAYGPTGPVMECSYHFYAFKELWSSKNKNTAAVQEYAVIPWSYPDN